MADMILQCPKCRGTQIQTTKKERWCRRCGYRTKDIKKFERKLT